MKNKISVNIVHHNILENVKTIPFHLIFVAVKLLNQQVLSAYKWYLTVSYTVFSAEIFEEC